jgi:hypothetical protein
VRVLCLALIALLAMPAVAQESPKKRNKAAAKPAATKQARAKPTPEQIRRFNELQKKNK